MANAKCKCTEHTGGEGWHGCTSGRSYHGCECERCTEYIRAYMRDYCRTNRRMTPAEPVELICARCGGQFESVRVRKYCPECVALARTAAYAARNQKQGKDLAERRLRLWEAQEGRCALCGQPLALEEACVDHDHACCDKQARKACGNCDRGVLHLLCNNILGMARDEGERLLQGAAYLRRLAKMAWQEPEPDRGKSRP